MRFVLYALAGVMAALGVLTVIAELAGPDAGQVPLVQGLAGSLLFFALAVGLAWLGHSLRRDRE